MNIYQNSVSWNM